jgi:Uma2 family endonuclease
MSVAEVPKSAPLSHDTNSMPDAYRFSFEQYYRLGEIGVFSPEDRVELIEGQVIRMNPVGAQHETATLLTSDALVRCLPSGWHVRPQLTVRLLESAPLPDLAVARGAIRDFANRHVSPNEVGLLIEISDSTLAYDRKVKGPLYAAGIVEYWIVNLIDHQVEVHRQPQPAQGETPASYAQREVVDAKGTLNFNLDSHRVGPIKVADLLP